ncbi:hypothetical protein ACEY67_20755 [Salmonella enterica subsp. enterica]|uniref:hypothetical protein n=1 Tax=Salmonella enterica TaxID=28901 RepID=UPI0035B65EAB
MNSGDEVLEYLIDQLRQRVSKFDVVAEIHKMSIDRSITGRSGYSDVENEIIDAYIGRDSDSKQIIHNLQQHLAGKNDEIRVLEDRLRRAKDKIKELQATIELMNADFNRAISGTEQSGCRKEDVQKCRHEWIELPGLFIAEWDPRNKPGYTCCRKCGLKEYSWGMVKYEHSEGWKENQGGDACPVPGDSEVAVEFRGGLTAVGVARDYRWEIDNNNWDIVKYRIIK